MKVESLVNFYDRESPEATEFRRLFLHLKDANGNEPKSVLITSSVIEEGKTLISSYLALTVADVTRRKVLLVDADLRRPMVNVLFKLPLENGLADLLEGKLKLSEAVKNTTVPELKIVTAGKSSESPTGLIGQPRLKDILAEMKFYFDFVIVDSPPVIPVSDSLLLGVEVDAVLLTLRAGKTPKDVAKRATNLLRNARVNLFGVVMNNLDEIMPYHYSSRYYSYRYYHKKPSPPKG